MIVQCQFPESPDPLPISSAHLCGKSKEAQEEEEWVKGAEPQDRTMKTRFSAF